MDEVLDVQSFPKCELIELKMCERCAITELTINPDSKIIPTEVEGLPTASGARL